MSEKKKKRDLGLTLIAIGKGLKATLLIAVGITALSMVRGDPPHALQHWANLVRLDHNNHYLHRAIEAVSGVSPRKLAEISFGTFAYAALFATEGLGLWFQKKWAEYLTIIITFSFIPLEIYEIVHHTTALKIAALVLNLAAAVYLIVRLKLDRDRDKKETKEKEQIAEPAEDAIVQNA